MALKIVTETTKRKEDHIVVFPFMAQGHTIPLLHLATWLSSRDIHVTVVTTSSNAAALRRHLPHAVSLAVLPFPKTTFLPSGCESTDRLPSPDLYPAFLAATDLLRDDFETLLDSMHREDSLPLCVISDFFLAWTLAACRRFSVPRLVFHGMSIFSMFISKALWLHNFSGETSLGVFSVPGAPADLRLASHDVPDIVRNSGDPNDPITQFMDRAGIADVSSWGVLVNSFTDVDRDYVAAFESFYVRGARAWLVGPLFLLVAGDVPSEEDDAEGCMPWLDEREDGSVIYVAFGTQTHVVAAQLDELALGLEAAGFHYLWAVRDQREWAPQYSSRLGKVVQWAPQRSVLSHAAIGGFMSHCGWNSVMESVAAGIPMLTWPMLAEQPLSAKQVVEELGFGLRIGGGGEGTTDVLRRKDEICAGVKELMTPGAKRESIREKAKELRRAAEAAVGEGGSSRCALDELLAELRAYWSSSVDDSATIS